MLQINLQRIFLLFGYKNDKDIALAIRYAGDTGAKIINMSFGKTLNANPKWAKEAFLYAEEHDVLLASDVGNNSYNNDENTSILLITMKTPNWNFAKISLK